MTLETPTPESPETTSKRGHYAILGTSNKTGSADIIYRCRGSEEARDRAYMYAGVHDSGDPVSGYDRFIVVRVIQQLQRVELPPVPARIEVEELPLDA